MTRARHHRKVVGGDAHAGRQHEVAGPQVLAATTHAGPRCDGVIDLEHRTNLISPLSRDHGVRAVGQRRAGRDHDGGTDVE